MDTNGKEFSPHIVLHICEKQAQIAHPTHSAAQGEPVTLAALVNLATPACLANLKRSSQEGWGAQVRSGTLRYIQVRTKTLYFLLQFNHLQAP